MFAGKLLRPLKSIRLELIVWLYENQGEMRFGAENRLYLILADSKDFTESWETKESVFANRA